MLTFFAGSFEGVIEVRGILGVAVNILGTRIVRGDWPVGSVVAREADLVEELGVSRSVIREAFRILGAKRSFELAGVVRRLEEPQHQSW